MGFKSANISPDFLLIFPSPNPLLEDIALSSLLLTDSRTDLVQAVKNLLRLVPK